MLVFLLREETTVYYCLLSIFCSYSTIIIGCVVGTIFYFLGCLMQPHLDLMQRSEHHPETVCFELKGEIGWGLGLSFLMRDTMCERSGLLLLTRGQTAAQNTSCSPKFILSLSSNVCLSRCITPPIFPCSQLGDATRLAFTIGKRVKVMATISGPGTEDLGYFSLTSSKSFFPSSLEKQTEDDLASAMQVTIVTQLWCSSMMKLSAAQDSLCTRLPFALCPGRVSGLH